MSYRIEMRGQPLLLLTQDEFDELSAAMAIHIVNGFRDGETRMDHVTITEVGTTQKENT